MKLFQVLLLNVATVAIALVAYDQLRSDTPGPSQERASTLRSGATDTVELEQRLSVLEADRRAAAKGTDRDALARVEALEAFIRNFASPGDSAPPPTEGESPKRPVSLDEPSAEEIRRFRKLREAVRREERVKKNKARVDGALGKLSINLTQRQRARIHTAYAAFEPRVNEIWTEAKTQARATIEAGGEIDKGGIVTSTTAIIQQEFAATLTGIVNHQADATAIAEALMPTPGRK